MWQCGSVAVCSVAVWQCGSVAVWQCGSVAVWQCGSVAVWQCGSVAVWQCGSVAVWLCSSVQRGSVAVWQCGSVACIIINFLTSYNIYKMVYMFTLILYLEIINDCNLYVL